VMYLPKFFHPDPSVDRQSGFLQPILNSSEILSDSIYIPYFKVISDNKDATLQTTIFEDKKILFQSEYRQKNKNSNLLADIGYVNDYKSSKSNNSNSLSHIFAKYESNLDLNKFNRSSLDIFLEKTSSDTYLGVFNNNLINTPILPSNYSKLTSGMYLALENENYQFDAGFEIYENLKGVSSGDRFQYTLPFYSYSKNPIILNNSTISLSSSGSNSLTETNKLTSIISNSISYNSFDIISKLGFKNNFNAYFNNKNIVSKNNSSYKSSLQSNIINIMEANTSLPLIKIDENYTKTIIPKISFRFNPSSMKDDSAKDRGIDVSNIFNIDRMNLGNSFEAGKSLTFGVDFRKENLLDINNYFSLKLGTVIRDTEEDKIPKSTTLNRKNSNLFGSIEKGLGENINLEYNFSLDNDYRTLEYNGITSNFNFDNFDSTFTYSEENGERGDASVWSNETSFNIDEKHYFTFGTRRNRKLSLTEYYDLVYDYRNDCLKAGFKYKKTYYDDRDIKPKEDLLLTITFSPLTTYEHKVNQDFYRN
jgi:LPS-assembly protein